MIICPGRRHIKNRPLALCHSVLDGIRHSKSEAQKKQISDELSAVMKKFYGDDVTANKLIDELASKILKTNPSNLDTYAIVDRVIKYKPEYKYQMAIFFFKIHLYMLRCRRYPTRKKRLEAKRSRLERMASSPEFIEKIERQLERLEIRCGKIF